MWWLIRHKFWIESPAHHIKQKKFFFFSFYTFQSMFPKKLLIENIFTIDNLKGNNFFSDHPYLALNLSNELRGLQFSTNIARYGDLFPNRRFYFLNGVTNLFS